MLFDDWIDLSEFKENRSSLLDFLDENQKYFFDEFIKEYRIDWNAKSALIRIGALEMLNKSGDPEGFIAEILQNYYVQSMVSEIKNQDLDQRIVRNNSLNKLIETMNNPANGAKYTNDASKKLIDETRIKEDEDDNTNDIFRDMLLSGDRTPENRGDDNES